MCPKFHHNKPYNTFKVFFAIQILNFFNKFSVNQFFLSISVAQIKSISIILYSKKSHVTQKKKIIRNKPQQNSHFITCPTLM